MIRLITAIDFLAATARKGPFNILIKHHHPAHPSVLFCILTISSLFQLLSQSIEHKNYGKGVDDILVKEDHSLPLFMAAVYVCVVSLNTLGTGE